MLFRSRLLTKSERPRVGDGACWLKCRFPSSETQNEWPRILTNTPRDSESQQGLRTVGTGQSPSLGRIMAGRKREGGNSLNPKLRDQIKEHLGKAVWA